MLQAELDKQGASILVSSAGLHAMVGHPADTETTYVAGKRGISLDRHIARQFTQDQGRDTDLILVMEPSHKAEIAREAPALTGKVFLFDQWVRGKGIADPYQRSREFHEAVFLMVQDGAEAWAKKLAAPSSRNG